MDDVQQQIDFLLEKLAMLRDEIPDTPLEAEKKAMEIGLIEEQLAELYEQQEPVQTAPKDIGNDLTEEIRAITDELMEIEIRMLKAELSDDEGEKVKLQLSANALKSRRQALIDEMKMSSKKNSSVSLEERVQALEKEVADLKALLYRLMTR
jgi:chromosome segregation ATPase